MNAKEIEYLRDLSRYVKEISSDPIWVEKRKLWADKNALVKNRPLILCTLPEEAWPEIIPLDTLIIDDILFREYEWYLKKQIYRYENIKDDEIISNVLYVPINYKFSDWIEGRKRPYAGDGKKAEAFYPSINDYSEIKNLKYPELITIDRQETNERLQKVQDVFGDILDVQLGLPFSSDTDGYIKGWGVSAIDVVCELRGLESVFYDMAIEPDFVHEIMAFVTEGIKRYLDIIEKEGLLRLNNNEYISKSNTPLGSNGLSITKELPGPNFNPNKVCYKDLWGYSMAQELSLVSPEMHKEFILPYQKEMTERFGLLSYGCCEPNDRKWDNIFETFENLREVSVSHVADLDIAADKIKNKYVFSWKPNCTVIANYDENEIRRVLSEGFEKTKGCHVITCLRDNITLFGEPQRASRWVEIAQEIALNY